MPIVGSIDDKSHVDALDTYLTEDEYGSINDSLSKIFDNINEIDLKSITNISDRGIIFDGDTILSNKINDDINPFVDKFKIIHDTLLNNINANGLEHIKNESYELKSKVYVKYADLYKALVNLCNIYNEFVANEYNIISSANRNEMISAGIPSNDIECAINNLKDEFEKYVMSINQFVSPSNSMLSDPYYSCESIYDCDYGRKVVEMDDKIRDYYNIYVTDAYDFYSKYENISPPDIQNYVFDNGENAEDEQTGDPVTPSGDGGLTTTNGEKAEGSDNEKSNFLTDIKYASEDFNYYGYVKDDDGNVIPLYRYAGSMYYMDSDGSMKEVLYNNGENVNISSIHNREFYINDKKYDSFVEGGNVSYTTTRDDNKFPSHSEKGETYSYYCTFLGDDGKDVKIYNNSSGNLYYFKKGNLTPCGVSGSSIDNATIDDLKSGKTITTNTALFGKDKYDLSKVFDEALTYSFRVDDND